MLKIKDNVDITTLTNFGYLKYGGYEKCYSYHYYIKTLNTYFFKAYKELFIDADSRIIDVFEYDCILGRRIIKLKKRWIKDLIQAGLVEKVGDE